VLLRLDADLVFLQEVENPAVLAELAVRAGYAEARLVEGSDQRGIDVAALSRLPIAAYVSHAGDRDPAGAALWPRDCVEVHVGAGAGAGTRRLVLVGTHLSSRLSDDGSRRSVQAARMRELADAVRAADPGALVLAGGDLNDPPEAPALAPLAGDGAWLDPLDPQATTWRGAQGADQLDALLVARGDAGAVVSAWVAEGEDAGRASDHLPVVLDLVLF
jgi:endonuclease/exonuclease/phosphatase family metal-dependent hydrolase